jgi:SAM-dependent methyltransferase
MSQEPYLYPGAELDLFAHARNWKRYWVSSLPVLHGDVLEVGAGIASNTSLMIGPEVGTWTCLEPDRGLLDRLRERIAADPALARCQALGGTVAELDPARRFDAIVYIDVLEHIDHDAREMRDAAAHLAPGGLLVVLAPAHGWLYTAFDRAIGHCRRYTKASLAGVTPPDTTLRRLFYLDSAGLLASAANRLLLKQRMPNASQIRFWDRVLVPCSRVVDPITFHTIGKSVVGVWERPRQRPPPVTVGSDLDF